MRALTARQQEILDIIRAYHREHGYGPSYRELASKLGIKSAHGVYDHLRLMRKKGAVIWDEGKVRSLRAVGDDPGPPLRAIEVFSRVRPGGGLAASDRVDVVRMSAGPIAASDFGVVVGDSKLCPNYQPGDYLFFSRRRTVTGTGEVAVVLAGDEPLVRRVTFGTDYVVLTSFSATVPPLMVRREDWLPACVMGVAVAMLRKYEPTPAQEHVDTL